jgi:hypothetical protein
MKRFTWFRDLAVWPDAGNVGEEDGLLYRINSRICPEVSP